MNLIPALPNFPISPWRCYLGPTLYFVLFCFVFWGAGRCSVCLLPLGFYWVLWPWDLSHSVASSLSPWLFIPVSGVSYVLEVIFLLYGEILAFCRKKLTLQWRALCLQRDIKGEVREARVGKGLCPHILELLGYSSGRDTFTRNFSQHLLSYTEAWFYYFNRKDIV